VNPRIIAIVGGKKSGKTTAIELLTRELVGRGCRVAAVKHIPEPNFTIDREGKDTWKYAQAGASTIVAVSDGEIATIEKVKSTSLPLKKILQKCRDADVVFLEGFRDLVVDDSRIDKILIVSSSEEFEKDIRTFHPVIAITGPFHARARGRGIPFVDVTRNLEKLADLIERADSGKAGK
jgi:molybdopterin-guanine dinucleotide biosynthesis protein MobB